TRGHEAHRSREVDRVISATNFSAAALLPVMDLSTSNMAFHDCECLSYRFNVAGGPDVSSQRHLCSGFSGGLGPTWRLVAPPRPQGREIRRRGAALMTVPSIAYPLHKTALVSDNASVASRVIRDTAARGSSPRCATSCLRRSLK